MRPLRLTPIALLVLLSACGGGGGDGGSQVIAPPPPPVRGTIVGSGPTVVPVKVGAASLNTVEPALFAGMLESAQVGLTKITGNPKCAITVHTVQYNSIGSKGEYSTASAAIMLPSGSDAACSGPRPVLLYAHGTNLDKTYDMANVSAQNEPRLVAAMYAAQGYIVVAPNYAGYAGSNLAYHPYLDAEQQSNDMVDALRAARNGFAKIGAKDSGKLFVSGYSQGGHVAMATLRAMQGRYASEFSVTATAAMSGPYALSYFGDSIFGGAPHQGVTAFLPLLINAGQRADGSLYSQPSDIYEAPYAATIENLLPGTASVAELTASGKLPATALFARDSLPQASGSGAYFGAGNLIKTSYRVAYQADMTAHPCTVSATDPLACAPQHALRKLVLKNDLRNFTPTGAGLMLCGGEGDPTVPYINTELALSYFEGKGAQVTVVNVDSVPGLNASYRTPKLGFIAAKLALRTAAIASGDSPDAAVEANYHAGLVPPFCIMASRDFFDGKLAP